MNRMYFWACDGSSSKLRAASVLQHQPGNVSYSTVTRVKTSMFAATEAHQQDLERLNIVAMACVYV